MLPILETQKAGAITVGTAFGVAALAEIYGWFSSKDDEKKPEGKNNRKKARKQ